MRKTPRSFRSSSNSPTDVANRIVRINFKSVVVFATHWKPVGKHLSGADDTTL